MTISVVSKAFSKYSQEGTCLCLINISSLFIEDKVYSFVSQSLVFNEDSKLSVIYLYMYTVCLSDTCTKYMCIVSLQHVHVCVHACVKTQWYVLHMVLAV